MWNGRVSLGKSRAQCRLEALEHQKSRRTTSRRSFPATSHDGQAPSAPSLSTDSTACTARKGLASSLRSDDTEADWDSRRSERLQVLFFALRLQGLIS